MRHWHSDAAERPGGGDQHIKPLDQGAECSLVLHTGASGEARPGAGVTQLRVWKEEVSGATLHPAGQVQR